MLHKPGLFHCTLCGKATLQRCAYCHEPVCQRCQIVERGKSYCTPSHRDKNTPLGRLVRTLERSLR